MPSSVSIDLAAVARDLDLPLASVQRTVDLLDEGNTVAFITRYRKDQTGGFDEEQIRRILVETTKLRMLAERKQTILKSIESQGKLTPDLAEQINTARSTKRLEDIYLPYKPKKQTLATIARQRGLEPFAHEILEASPAASDLDQRAADFVSSDRQLNSVAEVLHGVGHLLAERFSERADVRSRLRKIYYRTGKLVSSQVESAERADKQPAAAEAAPQRVVSAEQLLPAEAESLVAIEPVSNAAVEPTPEVPATAEAAVAAEEIADLPGRTPVEHPTAAEAPIIADAQNAPATQAVPEAQDATEVSAAASATEPAPSAPPQDGTPAAQVVPAEAASDETEPLAALPASESPAPEEATAQALPPAQPTTPVARRKAERKRNKPGVTAKDRKRQRLEAAFKDYGRFSEAISSVPPHRVLAINRGERAKILRVRVEGDTEAMCAAAIEALVSDGHPHADFLRACVRDALNRLILPSLEREIRRELTDKAEEHAVQVFIRNLRKLLLQPPVRGRRVLAVDPGFRSGSKLAALDEFGNVLESGMLHVIGGEDNRRQARTTLVDMIRRHNLTVVAIGNGTGCRDTEQLVAETLAEELAQDDVAYVIVNEAGASVYSTSPVGREELANFDAVLRSAVSIGRRLLDPLSELVKINPSNIGVGMYQHDVKAKHLRESLDAVVQSCVNFVGVDANTASPALLSYVSGLNQLTARRFYDYRREHGPFRNRGQFQDVPGVGEATFIQSAGFLKITDGDNPLDATWIHPESYDTALRVLEKLGSNVNELAGVIRASGPAPPATAPIAVPAEQAAEAPATAAAAVEPAATPAAPPAVASPIPPLAERAAKVDVAVLARELGVGELLLKDILTSLTKPRRDPRDDLTPPVFRRGVLKLEDLKPGMEMSGTVLNVVDFGAFVDIGISDSALVHISRLADHYVRDPHQVMSVGDIVRVWVVDVDRQRRRVALTAIPPGQARRGENRREAKPKPAQQRPKPAAGQRPAAAQSTASGTAGKGKVPPKRPPRPAPKPKVIKPITEAMAEGREPMRSFSDLIQFFERKQDGSEGPSPKKS